jgi:diphthine methyl ester synthase
MTVNTAVAQLMEVEEARGGKGICGPSTLGIGVARVGQETQRIVSGTLAELRGVDFGSPLHSLVLVGHMHELEQALFDHFRVSDSTPRLPPPAEGEDGGDSSDSGSDGGGGR